MHCSTCFFPSRAEFKEELTTHRCDPKTASYISYIYGGNEFSKAAVSRTLKDLTTSRKENTLNRLFLSALSKTGSWTPDRSQVSFPSREKIEFDLSNSTDNPLRYSGADKKLQAVVFSEVAEQTFSKEELEDLLGFLLVEDRGHYNRVGQHRRVAMAVSHVAPRIISKESVEPQIVVTEKLPTKSPSATLSGSILDSLEKLSPTVC